MAEKYKLQQEDINSMDLNGETLAKLKQILPEVFIEGADGKPSINIERLKIALGDEVDIEADDKTRYSFNWSGKKQAQALANQPSTATLRPSVEDSKNWNDTQNIYIEGDNLEVLKLLQKSYYGQIKMIYIDPPYNTGKDFVYKDNFHDNVKNYLQLTGQVDDEGNKISTNTDKSGRYHTDWLNMMYPRLKLARNLLRDDGVIFISIDDNEVHNLRKICDEIFGEDNFVAICSRVMKTGGNKGEYFSPNIDYVIVYAKSVNFLSPFRYGISDELIKKVYNQKEESGTRAGEYYRVMGLYQAGLDLRPNQRYWIKCPDGSFVIPPGENFPQNIKEGEKVIPSGRDGVWKWIFSRYYDELQNGNIIFKETNSSSLVDQNGNQSKWNIYNKIWLNDRLEDGRVPTNLIEGCENRHSSSELKYLSIPFDFAKPVNLVAFCMKIIAKNAGNIILDFFSGSATTAHAVMQLNAEDGGNRKYICVQLPEATDGNSEAYKAGYKNICEIGKERIRRAGENVLAEWQEKQAKSDLLAEDNKSSTIPDIGFKVFKLDTSNFKPFDGNFFSEEMVLSGRTSLDLFYELVLKQGYSLDYKQQVLDIGGTRCYALVNNDSMPFVLAVLDDAVKANFALELLKYALTLVIIKDDCFATDEIKLNTLATLEQLQSKDNPLQIRIV